MNNVATIPASIANQQGAQPSIVHIEDDVPSSVPDTTHINDPTLIKDTSAKLGKVEVASLYMDTCSSYPEPSFISLPSSCQNIENPVPPQEAN